MSRVARVGVLGSGTVGRTIGTKLVELGHEVCIGSRAAGGERAVTWARQSGERAREGAFADAAAFGELLFNCTAGVHSLDALEAAGAENLAGKVLIDVANPLDFSRGMPPQLAIANDDSLGERIQRAFPAAGVVKALNTVTAAVMIDPASVPGEHALFICGDDIDSKREASELLRSFGWREIIDLGGISAARAMEMYLPLWLRLMEALGTTRFNIAIAR
ncbi:MAG TPA: NAD(P)-binding domain-containing protein [Solirubrobacterales bacterium]